MVHQNRLKIAKIFPVPGRIERLGFILLISSLAYSCISAVWSVYIRGFVSSDSSVGFVSAFLMLLSFLSYFLMIPIIEKSTKTKVYYISSIFLLSGYLLYFFVKDFWLFLFIAALVTISVSFKTTAMGILIERNSSKKRLSENEGFCYTFVNIAYVIGPLLAGFIVARFGDKSVFLLAALFIIISTIFFRSVRLNNGSIKKKLDSNPFRNFLYFFKDIKRLKVYLLSAGLTFWWSLIFIYLPLLIIKTLREEWVGYFLFFVAIPLVVFQYHFGKLAGKVGYKKVFFLGFFIPAVISFLCFFITNIWFIMTALVIASVGLAMTESTTESYFFDICKGKEDQRFYAPYNTAIDTGSIIGEAIAALSILLFGFKSIFIVFGIGMLLLSLLSLRIKNVIELRIKRK